VNVRYLSERRERLEKKLTQPGCVLVGRPVVLEAVNYLLYCLPGWPWTGGNFLVIIHLMSKVRITLVSIP
jgi:hypothetical protein